MSLFSETHLLSSWPESKLQELSVLSQIVHNRWKRNCRLTKKSLCCSIPHCQFKLKKIERFSFLNLWSIFVDVKHELLVPIGIGSACDICARILITPETQHNKGITHL